jgi:PadR family transcriptional regulator AphA
MAPMVPIPLTIEFALLGFLRQRPMHGYEIHQQLREPTGIGLVWRIKQSQLYALLVKLEQEGYVSSTVEPQDNRPARKVFRLTETGESVFQSWLVSPVKRPRELRLQFLAKLYFARLEGSETARVLIQQQRTRCLGWLAEDKSKAEALRVEHPYDWLVWQLRISQIEAMLAWLTTCEQGLRHT